MQAYIAAPIFNDHQRAVVDEIEAVLRGLHFEVFSPYKSSQEIFAGRKPSECSPEERREVLTSNITGIIESKLMVAWVGGESSGHDQTGKPSSVDTGVVWEMGYAARLACSPAAFNLPPDDEAIVTLAYIHDDDRRQSLNLMLAGTVDAAAKGILDLKMALGQFAMGGGKHLQDAGWHPDKVLAAADKEPLV